MLLRFSMQSLYRSAIFFSALYVCFETGKAQLCRRRNISLIQTRLKVI